MTFKPGTDPEAWLETPGLWFILDKGRLLVRTGADGVHIPGALDLEALEEKGLSFSRKQFIGTLHEAEPKPCYAAALASGEPAEEDGFLLKPLRALLTRLDEDLIWAAGRANQLIHWEVTHSYCGACGGRTEDKADERAKTCPQCGLINYPRVTPAVIMAVIKDDRILLARNQRARIPFYSVLAGFVEPSETLEDCVKREVREEAGITVKNIRYFGSQPWPFPNSLMIGFTAEYAGGDIQINPEELSDAGWFARDNLPQVPPPLSIAGQLIDWFVKKG